MQTIRASEVGEYIYCARAWWLRRTADLEPSGSAVPARLAAGVRRHARHGLLVVLSRLSLYAGMLFLTVALLFLVLP
jgi:hypothetical protein